MAEVGRVSVNPAQSRCVIGHDLDDDIVLYHVERQEIHILNESAALIWARCDGRHDLDQLATALCEAYEEMDAGKIHRDVAETVAALRIKGLLQASGPTP